MRAKMCQIKGKAMGEMCSKNRGDDRTVYYFLQLKLNSGLRYICLFRLPMVHGGIQSRHEERPCNL